jgi:DeoR/GlpR family transcriptional regulator of sugar metabolism
MDVRARRELVLELLERKGRVSVAEVGALTEVSDMTVRRDLEALEREGALKRVHGGAISAVSTSYEPPFALRAQRSVAAKERIGRGAAELLREGETVILDVGTTTLEVARNLQGRRNFTVLTPSLRAAELLADEPGIQLIVTGGVVRAGERSLIGDYAAHAFSDLRFDTFVMGVGGIDPEAGLTEFNLDDARVKRAAIDSAQRCVVAADSSKLGRVAFAHICPLDAVDVLVTDSEAAPDDLAALEAADVEVIAV